MPATFRTVMFPMIMLTKASTVPEATVTTEANQQPDQNEQTQCLYKPQSGTIEQRRNEPVPESHHKVGYQQKEPNTQ
ncbi:hypothetical protein GCM10028825_43770 [Spirosoma agri]